MLKSFRFLFQFAWINLACLLGFAVLVVVGCYATGVPGGASNLFATYYGAFPLVTLFVLFLFAFSLCTSNLNLGCPLGPGGGTSSGPCRECWSCTLGSAGPRKSCWLLCPSWVAGLRRAVGL